MKVFLVVVLAVFVVNHVTSAPRQKRDDFIVGGVQLPAGYMSNALVYISFARFPSSPACTGAFISPRVIVTCAACVVGQTTGSIIVTGKTAKFGQGTTFPIEKISRSTKNGIAVLITKSDADGINTLTLPCKRKYTPQSDEFLTIYGWGYSGASGDATLNIADQRWGGSACKDIFPKADGKNYVCMKATAVKQSTCYGDCGGAVVKSGTLVGVVVGVPPDCQPGRYTLVASIKSAMLQLLSEDFAGCHMGPYNDTSVLASDKTTTGANPLTFPTGSCKTKMCVKWEPDPMDAACNKTANEGSARMCTDIAVQKEGFQFTKRLGKCSARNMKKLDCPCCDQYTLTWECYKCD